MHASQQQPAEHIHRPQKTVVVVADDHDGHQSADQVADVDLICCTPPHMSNDSPMSNNQPGGGEGSRRTEVVKCGKNRSLERVVKWVLTLCLMDK